MRLPMQPTIDNSASTLGDRLSAAPKSSTARQRSALVLAGKRRGMGLDEVRAMVGGSISVLSAKDASRWLTILTHRDLPNPPGGKPGPYKRRPRRFQSRACEQADNQSRGREPADTLRVITSDHIEQIGRLMLRYFEGNVSAAQQWFTKTWHVQEPADLLDTERAGKVIAVLKTMVKRRIRAGSGSDRTAMSGGAK